MREPKTVRPSEVLLEKEPAAQQRAAESNGNSRLRRYTVRFFETYCRFIFNIYCPLKVTGRHNIPSQPFILCSNHCSHMDSCVLMAAAGIRFERFGLIAAKDYFISGSTRERAVSLFMNILPVERGSSRRALTEHLDRCRDFTGNGKRNLIMYPEGTRSTTGRVSPFKKGAGLLSAELKLPIVPAYIHGTHALWPKGHRIIKPGPIRVTIGGPIFPGDYCGQNGKSRNYAAYRQITEELEKRILALKEESNGGG